MSHGVLDHTLVRNSALAELRKLIAEAQYQLAQARRLASRVGDSDLISNLEVAHRFSCFSNDQLNHIQSKGDQQV